MSKKAVFIIAVPVVIVMTFVVLVHSAFFNDAVLKAASKASGRDIQSDTKIDIRWRWPVTVLNAENLRVANFSEGTSPEMFSADKVKLSIDWRSVLRGDVLLPEVILDKPSLLLEKDKDGNANWNMTSNAGAAIVADNVTPDDRSDVPAIGKLVINDGRIQYKDPVKKTDLDLKAETITGEADKKEDLHFEGKGTYQGRPFEMKLDGGNVFQLKNTDEPYPIELSISAGGTRADVKGTMNDPLQLKGMNIELALKGQDAAELFTLIGVALPPTPPYDVKGRLLYADDIWRFRRFKGRMGDSDLSGSLQWNKQGERPLLRGKFISNNLDFDDLGGFIGATPSVKPNETASAAQKAKAAKKQESPFLLPDTPLDIERLSSMDARVSFRGNKLNSQNLPLDDFFMLVDLKDRVLKLTPVRFGTANGDIKALMTINAQKEPVKIAGDFYFQRLQLKPIFEKLTQALGIKNVTEGYIGGVARLKGTGKSLRQMLSTADGTIGLGMEGGQISNLVVELLGLDVAQGLGLFLQGDKPVPIYCMIGDFSVNDGMMRTRSFVFDTADTNINGKGYINLKDETMNMRLVAMPKDTSILSLNSPITLKGTLKHPEVNLKLENVAGRGAAAAVLAVIAAPAAALAFIEPGLGKDSNCARLIATMKADTKQTNSNMIPKNKIEKKPAKK